MRCVKVLCSILSKVQLMDRTTATRLAGEVDDWNTHA